jgi:hypothetical protein
VHVCAPAHRIAFNFFFLELLPPRILDAVWSIDDEEVAAAKDPDIKAAIEAMTKRGVDRWEQLVICIHC